MDAPFPIVPTVRGQTEVRTFLSALGFSRETRLTAVLGYLISQAPEQFTAALVGRRFRVTRVRIEPTEEDRRYDVVVEGPARRVVIEAKLGFQQRTAQVRAYLRRLRSQTGTSADLVLLDRGSLPLAAELRELQGRVPKGCRLIFRQWDHVARVCRVLAQRRAFQQSHPLAAALARDLAAHLQEEQMDLTQGREVYVRQLRGSSLDLFFRHRIYTCQVRFGPYASQHGYFAPLFTSRAPQDMAKFSSVPIKAGLSWVAPILAAATLRYADLGHFLKQHGVPEPKRAEELIRKGSRGGQVFLLALGKPFNLFTVPLSSKALGVKGMLGQRSLRFSELFEIAETAR